MIQYIITATQYSTRKHSYKMYQRKTTTQDCQVIPVPEIVLPFPYFLLLCLGKGQASASLIRSPH